MSPIAGARTMLELGDRVVQIERAGEGPPVVYLHGALGEGYWTDFASALAARHDVIVPAHPGYWDSTRPEWIETVDDLALHYLDVLDALGLPRVALVGSSMGGWIGASVAILRPDRVSGLVLLGPIGIPPEGPEPPDLFALPPPEAAELLFADPETDMARLLASVDLDDPPDVEIILPLLQTLEASARYAWKPFDQKLPERLRFATPPALVLTGSEDRFLPAGEGDRWTALLPNATAGTIAGAGHLPALERPAETATVVGDWLAANGAGPMVTAE